MSDYLVQFNNISKFFGKVIALKDVTMKIQQAARMMNRNLYDQLLAINNTLLMEQEQRKLDKKNKDSDSSEFDSLINVRWWSDMAN